MKKLLLVFAVLLLILSLTGCAAPTSTPAPTAALPNYPAPTQPVETVPTSYPLPVEPAPTPEDPLGIHSPDGRIFVRFSLAEGVPTYEVHRDDKPVILPSLLGFDLKDLPPLGENMTLVNAEKSSLDETWEQPWGEQRLIRNHYNELKVTLSEASDLPRQMAIVFRVYDDGLGFRYEIPEQPNLADFIIMEERTEFAFPESHDTWSIPAFQANRYEYLVTQEKLHRLPRSVHTPLTMKTASGMYIVLHEAALVGYPSMTLKPMNINKLQAKLVPWSNGDGARVSVPMHTPWRTIQLADRAADLINSYLILNLNDPNVLGDVSWVHPGKYIGIWWGMHLGLYTWGSGDTHGATTERTKEYIDFAAKSGFRGVLVEGWNLGWDGNWSANGAGFDFTTPYPDFDIEAITQYAAEKGIVLIGHHETAANPINYENQMEDAFAFYQALGVDTVKTGYVGSKLVPNQWHHGQYGVEHYQKVIETAAQYQISINAHEPIKDTGLRRTYPNFLAREGARGMEYDAWDSEGGNPPDHVTKLVFQRLLSGPMDFTPGIFNLRFQEPNPVTGLTRNQVNTTLAKELAYYVIIYSPLQMAADLPENYLDENGNPLPGFQFILDVPCDWEKTVGLDGDIGEFVVIARQDRNTPDWYLGAITDENARDLPVSLSFLTPGVTYLATIYADGPGAHWDTNPFPLEITTQEVTSETTLSLSLAPGGGAAVRFTPVP